MFSNDLINILLIGLSAGILRVFMIMKRRNLLFTLEVIIVSILCYRILFYYLVSSPDKNDLVCSAIVFLISIFAIDILEVLKALLDALKSPDKISALIEVLKLLKGKEK